MHDFQNLAAFFSQGDVADILEELKSVPVGFWKTWGNLTLPTGKDLPQAVPQRCAIVASGRTVLNEKAGQDINAVDGPVLRMNFAQTRRYEAFVGNRTDALVVNDQVLCGWMRHSYGPPPHVKMVVVNNFGHLKGLYCMQYLQERFPKVSSFVLDIPKMSAGLRKLEDLVADKGPVSLRRLTSTVTSTTGMIGGLFLMNLCKEVFHYGFLESTACRQHYWDTKKINCTTDEAHNLTKEHVIWKLISSTKGVNLPGEGIVYGWPRLQTEG